MTPQELRKARWEEIEKLLNYFVGADGYALGPIVAALDNLETLDKEYAAKSPNEWYEFVNLIDALWRNVKLCEGRTDSIITGLDTITAEILRFKARVSEEGKE